MTILTSSQCRAARALLNWSQSDLAEKADAHIQTISNFEKDVKIPTIKTLSHITTALELGGIEFFDDGGIRPVSNRVLTLQGKEGIKRLVDLIYDTACCLGTKSDLCVTNADVSLYLTWLEDYAWYHRDRMIAGKYMVRALIRKGDVKTNMSSYVHYRWLSQKIFSDVSIYLFGEKTAFLEFKKEKLDITIVDNPAVTRTMRKLFELSWETATEIPDQKSKS